MRTVLAIACLMAARFVPFLAYVMSLIGSFLTISVSVIFPAACHLSIFQARMHAVWTPVWDPEIYYCIASAPSAYGRACTRKLVG